MFGVLSLCFYSSLCQKRSLELLMERDGSLDPGSGLVFILQSVMSCSYQSIPNNLRVYSDESVSSHSINMNSRFDSTILKHNNEV